MTSDNFIVTRGLINYHFPFALRQSPSNLQSKYTSITSSGATYRAKVAHEVERVLDRTPGYEWGLAWLPNEDWRFRPHLWRKGAPGSQPADVPGMDADVEAFVSFDGFFFLAEYFRRQPCLRFRLSESYTVARADSQTEVVSEVVVDVLLNLAHGNGCITFRHRLDDLDLDTIISLRLGQFRRGSQYIWNRKQGPGEGCELQELYHRHCANLLEGPVRATVDVRRYGSSLELDTIAPGTFSGIPETIRKQNSIYGILFVDERWRDASPEHVENQLTTLAAWPSSAHVHFSQEVSILSLRIGEPSSPYDPSRPKLVDNYYRCLSENTKRTVADRSCILESSIIHENILYRVYHDYKDLIAATQTHRQHLRSLKKAFVLSRQDAEESFNVIPGAERLGAIRGHAFLRTRAQDASGVVDAVLQEMGRYNSEVLADMATAFGVGISLRTVLMAFNQSSIGSLRWSILVAAATFSGVRVFKYRSAATVTLLILWLLTAVGLAATFLLEPAT